MNERRYITVGDGSRLHVAVQKRLVTQGKRLVRRALVKVKEAVAEAPTQLCHNAVGVCCRKVGFRDEDKARYAPFFEQPPQRFRVRLHAVGGGDDEQGAVRNGKAALRLRGKIDVSRRVEQAQGQLPVLKHCGFGEHRYPPAPLYVARVKEAAFVIHPAEGPYTAAGVEHGFREGRFSCVHMCKDAHYYPFHKIP